MVTLHVANVMTAGDIIFSFLTGDTTGVGSVNSGDISQTKSQTGNPVSGNNSART